LKQHSKITSDRIKPFFTAITSEVQEKNKQSTAALKSSVVSEQAPATPVPLSAVASVGSSDQIKFNNSSVPENDDKLLLLRD